MSLFTPQNAREMAARSVAARRAAKIQRDIPPAPFFVQSGSSGDKSLEIDPARVRVRLETLDALMGKAKTDREWDNLSRAYDRLFRVWCTLTRTPGPGNYRPKAVPERRRELPVPVVVEPSSCG
jgi:hypothetical protein